MASGSFKKLPDEEKIRLRIRYAEQLLNRNDSFISDGHYSFLDDIVFTEADGDLYDVFIYLYCEPKIISERLKSSTKNEQFAKLSDEHIRKWQDFEIESLRCECHKLNKDFYVVDNVTSAGLQEFIDRIENGYSSYVIAQGIVEKIMNIYPNPSEIHICDGDKTIIKQDSFKVCTDNYVTHAFDGNFYTGYQSMQFSTETNNMNYNMANLSAIQLNEAIYNRIADKNYVILSSGDRKSVV